jgi:hypothetical protein
MTRSWFQKIPNSRYPWLGILFLYFVAWPLSLRTTILPSDAREAEIMLREGSLDSTEWQLIEPFYVQPINVPQGELSLLSEVFDVRIGALPATAQALSRYYPWDKDAIARFFADYPELVKYKPILTFEVSDEAHMSSAGLALSTSNTRTTTALSRFALEPGFGVAASGGISHGDTADVWVRRVVTYSFPNIASLSAGNFVMGEENGLFYGYFPTDTGRVTTLSNWKYAGSRAWNGLFVRSDRWRTARFSAFYHERPTEKAYGVFCDIGPSDLWVVSGGVSRCAPGISNTAPVADDYFFHYGVSGCAKGFEYSINAGSPRSSPLSVPASAQISRKSQNEGFSVIVARLPAGLTLSRSKIAFDCRNELDLGDSISSSDISLADCHTSLSLSRALSTSLFISYVSSAQRATLTAGAEASGRSFVEYKATYSYHMSTAASLETHKIDLTIERAINKFVRPSVVCNCYFTSAGFESVRGRVPVAISWPQGLLFAPYGALYAGSTGDRLYTTGIKEELRLSQRTWCDCDASTSITQTNSREWNINARACFCF